MEDRRRESWMERRMKIADDIGYIEDKDDKEDLKAKEKLELEEAVKTNDDEEDRVESYSFFISSRSSILEEVKQDWIVMFNMQ